VITIPQRQGQTDGQTTCRRNRQNRLSAMSSKTIYFRRTPLGNSVSENWV